MAKNSWTRPQSCNHASKLRKIHVTFHRATQWTGLILGETLNDNFRTICKHQNITLILRLRLFFSVQKIFGEITANEHTFVDHEPCRACRSNYLTFQFQAGDSWCQPNIFIVPLISFTSQDEENDNLFGLSRGVGVRAQCSTHLRVREWGPQNAQIRRLILRIRQVLHECSSSCARKSQQMKCQITSTWYEQLCDIYAVVSPLPMTPLGLTTTALGQKKKTEFHSSGTNLGITMLYQIWFQTYLGNIIQKMYWDVVVKLSQCPGVQVLICGWGIPILIVVRAHDFSHHHQLKEYLWQTWTWFCS